MNGQILHAPVILELGPEFYDEVDAAKFPVLKLRYRNQAAARTVASMACRTNGGWPISVGLNLFRATWRVP